MTASILTHEEFNKLTPKQMQGYMALRRRFKRKPESMYYDHILGCLMVHYAGIWIGVEKDGYTHS